MLLNLVRNAAQALEGRPKSDAATQQIRITGRREGAVAIIEVSDTGPGVPAKAREHLFEAFQTSGPARRQRARPCDRRRTGPRPWRRHPSGGRHHRRDLPDRDSGPAGGTDERAQRAGAGVSEPARFCGDFAAFRSDFGTANDRQMRRFRTLPSPAGAGSYGALSRPLEMFSECMRHRRALRLQCLAKNAPVAQLDRALDYESRGQEFESLRARHFAITENSTANRHPMRSMIVQPRRFAVFIIDRYIVDVAPLLESLFGRLGLEIIPSIEGILSLQQILETGVGALALEYPPHVIELVRCSNSTGIRIAWLRPLRNSLTCLCPAMLLPPSICLKHMTARAGLQGAGQTSTIEDKTTNTDWNSPRSHRGADGHPSTVSRAPPSSLTLSLPPANNISSSASPISPDSTAGAAVAGDACLRDAPHQFLDERGADAFGPLRGLADDGVVERQTPAIEPDELLAADIVWKRHLDRLVDAAGAARQARPQAAPAGWW